MEQVMDVFGALVKFEYWQLVGGLVLGAWGGDWMGRKFPNGWRWLRAGVKSAGDAAKDAMKG